MEEVTEIRKALDILKRQEDIEERELSISLFRQHDELTIKGNGAGLKQLAIAMLNAVETKSMTIVSDEDFEFRDSEAYLIKIEPRDSELKTEEYEETWLGKFGCAIGVLILLVVLVALLIGLSEIATFVHQRIVNNF